MSEVAASKNRNLCASAEIGRQASLRCWCPSDVRVQVPPRAPRPRMLIVIELVAIIYGVSFLFGSVVQLVRTLACHARGQGFKSPRSRHRHHRRCKCMVAV